MTVSVIIPAAGASTRLDAATRKPLLQLAGVAIILRTVRAIAALEMVNEIIVAAHPDDLDAVRDLLGEVAEIETLLVIKGGENRAESVWNALSVTDPDAALVAVHDAVRPFIKPGVCASLFAMAEERGAAIPVVSLTDTIKRIEVDVVTETLSRVGVMRVQTPQVFHRSLLLDAYELARETGGLSERITDDASLVEAYGRAVGVVMSDPFNIKITTPVDLKLATLYIKEGLVEEG